MLSGSAASTIASAIAGGNDDAEGAAAAVVRDAIADAFVEQHLIYCECH